MYGLGRAGAGEYVANPEITSIARGMVPPNPSVGKATISNYRGYGGNLTVDRIAGEIQGAVNQAERVLEVGGTGGTRWGAIYQHYKETGHWLEPIAKGNAIQQIADLRLAENIYLQDAGVLFNKGHVLDVRNKAGNLLRPDFQIPLPKKRVGIIDITTPGQAPKISKYDVPSQPQQVPQLINVTY